MAFGEIVPFAKVDAVAQFRTEPGVAVCTGVQARRGRSLSGKLSGSQVDSTPVSFGEIHYPRPAATHPDRWGG